MSQLPKAGTQRTPVYIYPGPRFRSVQAYPNPKSIWTLHLGSRSQRDTTREGKSHLSTTSSSQTHFRILFKLPWVSESQYVTHAGLYGRSKILVKSHNARSELHSTRQDYTLLTARRSRTSLVLWSQAC